MTTPCQSADSRYTQRLWFGLMPHEVFFGLFLLITWLRFGFIEGFLSGDALLYFGCIICNVLATVFTRHDGPHMWPARTALLFYPVAMNVLFTHMRLGIPKIISGRMDDSLQAIDTAMLGGNLSLKIQPLVHPLLTELFSFCYILFFPYLVFTVIYYLCSDLSLFKKFVAGLFTVYGIGFLGYTLVPAGGPYLAMSGQFQVPLDGYVFTRWNSAVVAQGSNGVDVFPSLHCAVSAFFLFFDFQHRRWRFWLYLVPSMGLWASTIYLRYHYVIDVICGFALAAFALWASGKRQVMTPLDKPIPESSAKQML